jgi:hypothetical protein
VVIAASAELLRLPDCPALQLVAEILKQKKRARIDGCSSQTIGF